MFSVYVKKKNCAHHTNSWVRLGDIDVSKSEFSLLCEVKAFGFWDCYALEQLIKMIYVT